MTADHKNCKNTRPGSALLWVHVVLLLRALAPLDAIGDQEDCNRKRNRREAQPLSRQLRGMLGEAGVSHNLQNDDFYTSAESN